MSAPPAVPRPARRVSVGSPLAGLGILLLLVLFIGTPVVLALDHKAAAVGIILLVVLGAWWIVRRRGEQLLGPHFTFELIRLARHRGLIRARVLYALALLAGLCWLYANHFGRLDLWAILFSAGPASEPNALARFAERFVHTFFLVQVAAVLVLTPAYVAPALPEERDKGTLDLLRTSPVSDREIVVGKFMARVVHLAGVLLTGLPILALVQFFGGVDMDLLLAGFVVTGLTLLSSGGMCILASALTSSVWNAVLAGYFLNFVLNFAFMSCWLGLLTRASLFPMLGLWHDFGERWISVAVFGLVHGVIGMFAIFWAISTLRIERVADRDRPDAVPEPVTPKLPLPVAAASTKLDLPNPFALPPIPDQPLLWKEMYLGPRRGSPASEATVVAVLFGWPILMALCLSQFMSPPDRNVTYRVLMVTRFMVVGLGAWLCLGVGFRAAGSVVRERQQRTLDALLSLPIPRGQILRAKWWGSIRRMVAPASVLAIGLAMCPLLGALHPLSSLLVALAIGVHGAFSASLGLWLSVLSPTSLRAYCLLALVVVGIVVLGHSAGPEPGMLRDWVVSSNDSLRTVSERPAWWFCGLADVSPVNVWWKLGFSWSALDNDIAWWRVLGLLQSLALYALAAVVLWTWARRRFERSQ